MEIRTKSHTILYADDDIDDQEIFSLMCNAHKDKIRLVIAYNGKDAITYLENLKEGDSLPCLIVLDMNMPISNGLETMQTIRKNEKFNHIPIAVISTNKYVPGGPYLELNNLYFFHKPNNLVEMEVLFHQLISTCDSEVIMSLGSLN